MSILLEFPLSNIKGPFAVIENGGCRDLEQACSVDGISSYTRPSVPICGSSRPKRTHVAGGLTTAVTMPVPGLNLEFEDLNRYVYPVKYYDGRVRLSVTSHADKGFGGDETQSGCMSGRCFTLLSVGRCNRTTAICDCSRKC